MVSIFSVTHSEVTADKQIKLLKVSVFVPISDPWMTSNIDMQHQRDLYHNFNLKMPTDILLLLNGMFVYKYLANEFILEIHFDSSSTFGIRINIFRLILSMLVLLTITFNNNIYLYKCVLFCSQLISLISIFINIIHCD